MVILHLYRYIFLFSTLLLFGWFNVAIGQIDTTSQQSQSKPQDQNSPIQLTRDTAVVDTVMWISAHNPYQTGAVNTYLKDTLIFFYNPAKPPDQEHATLGNLGSPYYELFFKNTERIGLRINDSPYSLYDFDLDKFKFYSVKAGYTDVTYSQTGQSNNMFDGLFTRNFNEDKTNYVLKYRRINQAGIYTNQELKHTYLSSGIRFHSFDDRLQTSILFSTNLSTHNSNGGITDDASLNTINAVERENVQVNMTSSSSNRNHRLQYAMTNSWSFFGKKKTKQNELTNSKIKEKQNVNLINIEKDTIAFEITAPIDSTIQKDIYIAESDTLLLDQSAYQSTDSIDMAKATSDLDTLQERPSALSRLFKNRSLSLFHTIQYDKFFFVHKNDLPDTTYLKPYDISSDSVDYNLNGYSLSNEFGLRLTVGQINPVDLSSSVEYIRHSIHAAKYMDRLADLILHNKISFKIKDQYLFNGLLDLGLGNNQEEILAVGSISAKPNKLFRVHTSLTLLTQRPLYSQSNIVLNDSIFISNSLKNQKSLKWSATVDIPKYKVNIGYNSLFLSDFVYWDQNRMIQQAHNSIRVQQFTLKSRIKWRFINLHSQAKFQLVSDRDKLRLPPLLLQETLFINGSIFKKQMKYQLGVHVRLIGKYDFMTYFPTLGIFHHSDTENRHSYIYPDATAFFEFQVDAFKMFILAENLRGYFQICATCTEFELANYPQFDNRLRLGIRWVFRR